MSGGSRIRQVKDGRVTSGPLESLKNVGDGFHVDAHYAQRIANGQCLLHSAPMQNVGMGRTVAERLREARALAGYEKATDAAKAFDWPSPTYLAHENGSRGVPLAKVEMYASVFRVDFKWLATGIGVARPGANGKGKPSPKAAADGAGQIIKVPAKVKGIVSVEGEDYAAIARYELQGSAGPGRSLPGQPRVLHRALFRMAWLRRVSQSPIDKLAIIDVQGDSASPTLEDGDAVLIDLLQKDPRREGIYALNEDGDLKIKRLSQHPITKKITIISENKVYPSYPDIDPKDIDVVGRVIWAARAIP